MASFAYRGRSAGGELVEGQLEAANAAVAADQLASQRIKNFR